MEIFLKVAHVLFCLVLVFIVLIQRDRGGGLAGAFGGASMGTSFGIRTAGVLIKITAVLFALVVVTALALLGYSGRPVEPAVPAASTAVPSESPPAAEAP
jgi:preprotein translocase subunit SecG